MTQKDLNRDFTKKTISTLSKRGMVITSKTWLPDLNGRFANGETGYVINDNGTSRVLTFSEMISKSKGGGK